VTTRYQRAESALWRRSADAVVVLVDARENVFTLRGSGAALWDVLGHARTLDEAAHELGTTFDLPAESVAAEIGPVILELVRRKAVLES
jgi:hypothetical protein